MTYYVVHTSELNRVVYNASQKALTRRADEVVAFAKEIVATETFGTGRLEESIKSTETRHSPYKADAKIGSPLYYADWVDTGRGAVRPVKAPELVFNWAKHGGVRVVSQYIRPWPGIHYLERALRLAFRG